ncbi:MAG: helix-turn-helix domain-containing protein [Lachnospiraceae bacterium]|uniref:helix-turn-helix domain-containing protein n=1 Tax=Parablautia sp. Marseille-Q6255 TaxID=3039593 RepID=UPI0024BCC0D3|nr:helix-turn-helix domain-containing protein [Parablautia sp. Marseille-Q6255]
MSAQSKLERDLISQRTKEGLAGTKARSRSGGRHSKQKEYTKNVRLLYQGGMKVADIVRSTGLSRSTVNRVIRVI